MKKFYLLDDPMEAHRFAMFSHLGTWSDGELCKTCGRTSERLVEPLLLEWLDGTQRIGDFSWCGYTAVVSDPVREFMEKLGFEVDFGVVNVVKPTGRPRMPRVPYPYEGPHLNWLIPAARVKIDLARSRIKDRPNCPECGQSTTVFRRTRLFISQECWHGENIFRIEQFDPSSATFVTEDGLKLFKSQGFSNFVARLAGQIGD